MLEISPHKEDKEIRILVDRHVTDFLKKGQTIGFRLYAYLGEQTRIVSPLNVMRSSEQSDREVYSDVFVFESTVSSFLLFPEIRRNMLNIM